MQLTEIIIDENLTEEKYIEQLNVAWNQFIDEHKLIYLVNDSVTNFDFDFQKFKFVYFEVLEETHGYASEPKKEYIFQYGMEYEGNDFHMAAQSDSDGEDVEWVFNGYSEIFDQDGLFISQDGDFSKVIGEKIPSLEEDLSKLFESFGIHKFSNLLLIEMMRRFSARKAEEQSRLVKDDILVEVEITSTGFSYTYLDKQTRKFLARNILSMHDLFYSGFWLEF